MDLLVLISFLLLNLSLALGVSHVLYKRKMLPSEFLLLGALGVFVSLGYIGFYIHVGNPHLGRDFTRLVMLGGTATLLYLYMVRADLVKLRAMWLYPLVIIIALGGLYGLFAENCQTNGLIWGQFATTKPCVFMGFPEDNYLPFMYGKNVDEGHSSRTVGEWQLADRPPLQVGVVSELIDGVVPLHNAAGAAQAAGLFLQLSWVAAVWGFLKYIRAPKRQFWITIGGLSMTGFIYFNSIYVWPKLLSASFVLAATALLLYPRHRPTKRTYLGAAAVFVTLGLLAHEAVIFTVIPLIAIWLYREYQTGLTKQRLIAIGAAAAVGLCFIVPWQFYKTSTTHGDRLIKWHLAGVEHPDSRSARVTIIDAYAHLTPITWINNKAQNIETLFYYKNYRNGHETPYSHSGLRALDFFSTFFALGFLSIGFIYTLMLVRKGSDSFMRQILWLAAASLTLWVLIMFEPNATVIHQDSYATMLLLFIAAGYGLSRMTKKYYVPILGLQAVWFMVIWIVPFLR